MFYISGPGHGGAAMVGNTYLEGSYSEIYQDIPEQLFFVAAALNRQTRCADASLAF